jgi:hypothetical protein
LKENYFATKDKKEKKIQIFFKIFSLTIFKDVVTTHTIFRGVQFTVLQLGIDYIGRWNHTKMQYSTLDMVKIDLYLTAPAKSA